MKNQYFGDEKDYLTYGLLRVLSQAAGLRVGVAWMLTPDTPNGEGEQRAYLDQPARWQTPDPSLYVQLQHISPNNRRVEHVGALELLPGAVYFAEPLPPMTGERAAYFERLFHALQDCELLFFDPDNGIETPTLSRGPRRSPQHIYWDELQAAYRRGHSLLVFQHFPRRARAAYLAQRAGQLAHHLEIATVDWFQTAHVAFFLIAQPEHAVALAAAPVAVHKQWGEHIQYGQFTPQSARPGLELSLLAGRLAVCRLGPAEPLPAWAGGGLTALTRTPDELSVVCAEACVPDGIQREGGWRALKVAGPLDFSLTGILAALAGPLAAAGVSIFAISTYDTDYVLVQETALERATAVLRAAGHRVNITT